MSTPPQRRVWNWPWRLRRLRQDVSRGLAAFAMFLVVIVVSIIGVLSRLSFFVRRRVLGLRPHNLGKHRRTIATLPAQGRTGRPRRQVLLLDNGRRSATIADPHATGTRSPPHPIMETADLSPADRAAIVAAANAAIHANLSMCLSPAAAIAVADDAHGRAELYWDGLEAIFGRLAQLDTSASDIRELMMVCSFEWVYEMPTETRIIRLIENPDTGAMRWRHKAVHLIEFEFSGTRQEARILPKSQLHLSRDKVQTFFNQSGRFVHWKRKIEPYRRRSF